MRIAAMLDERGMTMDEIVASAEATAAAGLGGFWMGEHFGWDALTALALVGRAVPEIELGTAVLVTQARHPLALASHALTAQAAMGGRLALGIGLSHRPIVEGQLGLSYEHPARQMREYLSALAPLLRGESVEYRGRTLSAAGQVEVPGANPPSLLVAALGPRMLRLAGELADGTIVLWAGLKAVSEHVVPTLTSAASAAGRPEPRVVAGVPVVVTADPDGVRRDFGEQYAIVGTLPSYRAMLDRSGVDGPGDLIVAGDEAVVEAELTRLSDAGVTDLLAVPVGDRRERERTAEVLTGLRG